MLAAFKGRPMWWFTKRERKEIWDEAIQWPIGDIEAAHKIRDICRSALDSAEKVSGFAGRPDSDKSKYETERYERAAKAAMEIAMKISDGLLRDASVRQIVTLCVKANDLRTARILFRAIQAVSMREDVLNEFPSLRS
jgi:isocitrate/isopropylmalate dehydrogenase